MSWERNVELSLFCTDILEGIFDAYLISAKLSFMRIIYISRKFYIPYNKLACIILSQ